MSMRVLASAKLNLLLRVLGREASGYHSIETLFIKLNLHDVVIVNTAVSHRTLSCDGPMMPTNGLGPMEHNLAYRAAELFTERAKWATGFAISVEKNIPVGGGLGGGSANAAAVLRALNVIAPQPLAPAELLEIAGALGSDVPFLLSDALLAWGWERGDRLLALPALPSIPVQLITFAEGVNTGAAYQALGITASSRTGATSYAPGSFSSWERVAQLAANDFERVVPALHPGVAEWLPQLRSEASRLTAAGQTSLALMSGSGATCFLAHPPGAVAKLAEPVGGVRLVHTSTASAVVPPEHMI